MDLNKYEISNRTELLIQCISKHVWIWGKKNNTKLNALHLIIMYHMLKCLWIRKKLNQIVNPTVRHGMLHFNNRIHFLPHMSLEKHLLLDTLTILLTFFLFISHDANYKFIQHFSLFYFIFIYSLCLLKILLPF